MAADAEPYHLGCSPATVCWGYMDPAVPPRLSVPDGARVLVDCVNGGPEVIPTEPPREGLGQPEWLIPSELAEIHEQVTERVNPGHILTGPVFVEGAEPGDVLRIDIEAVDLRTNWAWTASRPYGGAFADTEPAHLRHTLLAPPTSAAEPGAGWAFPAWGGRLDLQPFFGVIGVAPPPEIGRQSSIPPRNGHGGNLDCKELIAGTTLFLPVNVPGALLFVGDGHARQGDGANFSKAVNYFSHAVVDRSKHPFCQDML